MLPRWYASLKRSILPSSCQGASPIKLLQSHVINYQLKCLLMSPSGLLDRRYARMRRGAKGCTALLRNPILYRLLHVAGLTPGLRNGKEVDEGESSRWRCPWTKKARTTYHSASLELPCLASCGCTVLSIGLDNRVPAHIADAAWLLL